MVVRAIWPIAKGEELTSTYLGSDARSSPCEQRRTYLRDHFDFDCVCDLCLSQSKQSSKTKEQGTSTKPMKWTSGGTSLAPDFASKLQGWFS